MTDKTKLVLVGLLVVLETGSTPSRGGGPAVPTKEELAKNNALFFEMASKSLDAEGYRRFVAAQRRAFEDEVDLELGAPKPGAKSGEVKPAAGTGR
jgi:hypothetical protein